MKSNPTTARTAAETSAAGRFRGGGGRGGGAGLVRLPLLVQHLVGDARVMHRAHHAPGPIRTPSPSSSSSINSSHLIRPRKVHDRRWRCSTKYAVAQRPPGPEDPLQGTYVARQLFLQPLAPVDHHQGEEEEQLEERHLYFLGACENYFCKTYVDDKQHG